MEDFGNQTDFDTMKQDSNIERIEANPPECFCPICKSANIEIAQTFKNASGRTFFELRCSDCDSRFVLLEDLINPIRWNIENAKITEEKLTSEMEKFLEVDL